MLIARTTSRNERFPCAPQMYSSNALTWPLTVAFACANWQVVTVIHKWAGSRPREQGHSILRSRRGHLIVIIVTPNAASCRHSHAYRRPPGSHALRMCVYTQKRELFPACGHLPRASRSLLPAERLPKSFMFVLLVERTILPAINGKLIILYGGMLAQNADNLTGTLHSRGNKFSRWLPP